MSSIDVIVPCYRYGCYLRECVESVLNQGIADLRILIIDDESPDETPDVGAALVEEDSRVTYRRHATNCGHIQTFNEGIDWLNADYMLLLSADDYLLPGALKRAMELMDAHPDVGLCFGDALELYDCGTRPSRVDIDTCGISSIVMSGADFIRHCARVGSTNIVPTPTAVVRTILLRQLGGYRADLPHTGDLEMWLRLAAHGSVGFVKADQAVYRRHANNMSLAYYYDHGLADLQQRKAAFDIFLRTCRDVLPGSEGLYRSLLRSLADNAVGYASSAFNDNRMELSHRLGDFALEVDPKVRRRMAWTLLVCKKLMGLQLSSTLSPSVACIRETIEKIRRLGRRKDLPGITQS